MSEQWIDIMLYAAYILLGVAALAAVFMNLYNSLKSPKSLIKSGIGIVALVVIFFIGYSMAPSELDRLAVVAFEANEMDPMADSTVNVYKLVGGAMTTTLVLLVLALAGLLYSSIARIVK
jgi:glucokinase